MTDANGRDENDKSKAQSSSGTSNFLLKENKSNHMEDQPGLLYNRSVCYIEFSGGFCRGFIV